VRAARHSPPSIRHPRRLSRISVFCFPLFVFWPSAFPISAFQFSAFSFQYPSRRPRFAISVGFPEFLFSAFRSLFFGLQLSQFQLFSF
jgi:hypothetical protein